MMKQYQYFCTNAYFKDESPRCQDVEITWPVAIKMFAKYKIYFKKQKKEISCMDFKKNKSTLTVEGDNN